MSGYRISPYRSLLLAFCVTATASTSALAVPPAAGAAGDGFRPLDADQRVHWQPGAEAIAVQVASELPSAIAQVEAAHGRPFPLPVRVYVCGDLRRFATFSPTLRAAAVMDGSAIILSPRIAERPERLFGLIVHELSHLHLVQHIGAADAGRLPVWFREGLAVFLSGGAGAERVTGREAELALMAGQVVLFDEGGEPMARWDAIGNDMTPHMFYRQAGLFVAFLGRDAGAFQRLLQGILDGREFGALFLESYGGTQEVLFREFTDGIAKDPKD